MSKRNKLSCGGKCGHTKSEHRAFDRGYWAGKGSKNGTVKNPYNAESAEWDAFDTGVSAGRSAR